jgi:hypothetical protein
MHIYDFRDKQGRAFAFEIDNLLVSRNTVAEIVRSIAGARVLRQSRSWWGPDVFCEFEVGGTQFHAWEPWGDSSRYWIGPEPPQFSEQTAIVRAAFAAYSPLRQQPTSIVLKLTFVLRGLFLAATRGETWLALAIVGAVGVGAVLWAINAARRRKERGVKSAK